jgi:hypothetical protein
MTMKTHGFVIFTVSLFTASGALVFSPARAAAAGCTITCETCHIDDKTGIAECQNCTFHCTSAIQ